MGLPLASIMTGFPGLAEPGAAHDVASARTQATTPSPSGITPDAESAGTQTPASSQNDLGSDGASHYPLSDAALLALQLRATRGKLDVPPKTQEGGKSEQTQAPDGLLDLSSQESDLEAALKSMGISPGAIQEFMYMGRMLAQVAPGLFQDFVAQVVNLADLYKRARLPGFGGPVAQAQIPKSQSEIEMASVQEVQASASLTQTSSGETLNVSVQKEALTFVSLAGGLSQGQSTSTAQPLTAASLPSSAPNVTPSPRTEPATPAA